MKKSSFILTMLCSMAFVFFGCAQPTTEIVELVSIAITKNPTKVEYTVGEQIDTAGLEVTATYSDKLTKVVTGWTVSGFDSSVAAEKQVITVIYSELEVTKTASFNVSIKEKASDPDPENNDPNNNSGDPSNDPNNNSGDPSNDPNNPPSNPPVYGLSSSEGRLILEPVDKGIKVTLRLLDSDLEYFNNNGVNFNNFEVKEVSSRIKLNLKKPKIELPDREVSGIFPFVENGRAYEFVFAFSEQLNNQDVVPYHVEHAVCTATADGLKLEDYFNFDFDPNTINLYVDDRACLHIDTDIMQYFKTNVSNVYLTGTIITGHYDWSNGSNWADGWYATVADSNFTEYGIGANYSEMLSPSGSSIYDKFYIKDYSHSHDVQNVLIQQNTWAIDGNVFFTLDDIPLDNKDFYIGDFILRDASTDVINWQKTLEDIVPSSSSDFGDLPTSVGENPITSNCAISPSGYRDFKKNDNYTYRIYGDGRYEILNNNDECTDEGIYTWNAEKNEVYVRQTSKNGKTYDESLAEATNWNEKVNVYFEFKPATLEYSFTDNKLTLKYAEITQNNISQLLLESYANYFRTTKVRVNATSMAPYLYCGHSAFEFYDGENQFSYFIGEVGSDKITVYEGKNYTNPDPAETYLCPKIELPYTYDETNKILKITYNGTEYTLDSYKENTIVTGVDPE